MKKKKKKRKKKRLGGGGQYRVIMLLYVPHQLQDFRSSGVPHIRSLLEPQAMFCADGATAGLCPLVDEWFQNVLNAVLVGSDSNI